METDTDLGALIIAEDSPSRWSASARRLHWRTTMRSFSSAEYQGIHRCDLELQEYHLVDKDARNAADGLMAVQIPTDGVPPPTPNRANLSSRPTVDKSMQHADFDRPPPPRRNNIMMPSRSADRRRSRKPTDLDRSSPRLRSGWTGATSIPSSGRGCSKSEMWPRRGKQRTPIQRRSHSGDQCGEESPKDQNCPCSVLVVENRCESGASCSMPWC